MKNPGYSLENAQSFGWASLTGTLNPARVSCLQKYLVGHRILDAGCGGGGYVKFLTEQGLESVGVDKYEDFLQVARDNDPEGAYFQGDLTDLPFEDDSFDCTFCFDVLEHVDDYSAIAELARVTKNRLIVAVPREDKSLDEHGITLRHYIDHTHLRYYTTDSLRTLANSVAPAHVSVHTELPVDFAGILSHVARLKTGHKSSALARLMTSYYSLRQTISHVARLRAPKMGESRRVARQQTENFLKAQTLNQFDFPKIPTGVVAIIDLEKL